MLIINYNATHGQPIADGSINYFTKHAFAVSRLPNKKGKKLFSISVGTKAVVKEFQNLIAKGEIKAELIKFRFNKKTIKHDLKGKLLVPRGHELF